MQSFPIHTLFFTVPKIFSPISTIFLKFPHYLFQFLTLFCPIPTLFCPIPALLLPLPTIFFQILTFLPKILRYYSQFPSFNSQFSSSLPIHTPIFQIPTLSDKFPRANRPLLPERVSPLYDFSCDRLKHLSGRRFFHSKCICNPTSVLMTEISPQPTSPGIY